MPNKIEFTLNDGYLQSDDNTVFNLILCKIKMLTADNCHIYKNWAVILLIHLLLSDCHLNKYLFFSMFTLFNLSIINDSLKMIKMLHRH